MPCLATEGAQAQGERTLLSYPPRRMYASPLDVIAVYVLEGGWGRTINAVTAYVLEGGNRRCYLLLLLFRVDLLTAEGGGSSLYVLEGRMGRYHLLRLPFFGPVDGQAGWIPCSSCGSRCQWTRGSRTLLPLAAGDGPLGLGLCSGMSMPLSEGDSVI